MQAHAYVALVTLLTVLVYLWMGIEVGRARGKAGIEAPAMTGDPRFERTIRAHINTLEWLPIFLPSLWLFAMYWDAKIAAGIGLVWLIGRILYFRGYVAEASKRSMGFLIQALAGLVLLLGALGRIVYLLATGAL